MNWELCKRSSYCKTWISRMFNSDWSSEKLFLCKSDWKSELYYGSLEIELNLMLVTLSRFALMKISLKQ